MNKAEFLKELDNCLQKMQKAEREKFKTFYDEMIADYMEEGMSEAEAVQKVGNPQAVAEEILSDVDTVILPIPKVKNNVVFIILLLVGFPLWGSLLLAALLLILSAYIVLWCIPFSTGVGTISFFAASLVSIIGSPFIMYENFGVGLTQFGLGVASFGIAILLAYITVPITKKIAFETKKLSMFLFNMVKRSVKP